MVTPEMLLLTLNTLTLFELDAQPVTKYCESGLKSTPYMYALLSPVFVHFMLPSDSYSRIWP